MKEEIVTVEEYRGYEIQVREEWHFTGRTLTGYGIDHTGGDLNLQMPSTKVSLLASAAEVYEAIPTILENTRDVVDVVYGGDPDAVLDEMDEGNIARIWTDKRLEVGGERLSQVEQ